MKSTELRIGNIVLGISVEIKDGTVKKELSRYFIVVDSINEDGINLDSISGMDGCSSIEPDYVFERNKNIMLGRQYIIEPIPLTQEWWPKFGYESIQEFACHIPSESENHLGIDIDFYNDAGIKFIESLPIHKIQNLFYENTGEELTLIDLKNKQP